MPNVTAITPQNRGSFMLNSLEGNSSDSNAPSNTDTELMPPRQRRELLDQQIAEIGRDGYRVMSQVGYVVVMAKAGAPRIEIFVDEFGHIHR